MKEFASSICERGIQCTNRMMGWEAGHHLPSLIFLPSRIRPWEPRPSQYTNLRVLLGSHSVRPHILRKSTSQWLRMMRRTLLPWWGWNAKDGTGMTTWIWIKHLFRMDQTPIPYSYHSNKILEVIGSISSTEVFHIWNQVCHACHNCHSKWQNFDTVPNLQRCAKWMNCTWIYYVSCGRKVHLPGKGVDRWGDDEWMDWRHFSAMEGPAQHKQSFHSTTHPHTWRLPCAKDGFDSEPNPVNGDRGRTHPGRLHLFVSAIDIGINKPIKTCLRKKWEDWMTGGEGIEDGVVKKPSC